MFGHVRGAFTGAVAERRGYVAEAEGGTLFIDEVTDLSLRCQSKLLRFLTDKEYRRLGECDTRRANIRLLTAANVALPERVAAGVFRQDLLFRVNGTTLALPPLRERGDDVLVLARHFLARKSGHKKVTLSPDVVKALRRYSWPGNVRELENEMDRAAAFAVSGSVCVEHLSANVREPRPTPFRTLDDAVSACERDVITGALAQHSGNRSRAAGALGISRQALLGKIQRYGI
jgi:Nif-specific regulatory protein